MFLIFILTIVLFGTITCATLAGITMHDIRLIRHEHAIAKHPYAKKWRYRPLISIIIKGTPTDACLTSIKNNNYRKKEIITASSQTPKSEYIMQISGTTILAPTAILDAVLELNNRQNIQHVELRQALTHPVNVHQLLKNYQLFAHFIFQKSRSGLIISLHNKPTMTRRKTTQYSTAMKIWNIIYGAVATTTQAVIPVILAYVLYITFILRQPNTALITLAIFGAFMISAIWSYAPLSFTGRLRYIFLLPVSLGFFVIISWTTLLHIPVNLLVNILQLRASTRTTSRM